MNTLDLGIGKLPIWKIITAVGLLLLPFLLAGSEYPLIVCCFILIYIISVSGLDIVFGYCGQISMGQAAFYAIGAYGSALMHNYLGIPVIITMILSAVIGAIVGALLAYPASKLVFHFLSLATISFAEIIYILISRSPKSITGDYRGMFTDFVNLFGYELNTNTKFYYFALVCAAIFLLVKTYLIKSKTGRAFTAIRENTHAADGMGINVRKYKVIAFATSSFFTAFAGAMYVHLTKFINPDTFVMKQSVLFLTMLLFGGTGSLMGPIVGSVSVLLLTELLRSAQEYMMLIYGVLMLIVIVLIPGGLYGTAKEYMASKTKRITGGNNAGC